MANSQSNYNHYLTRPPAPKQRRHLTYDGSFRHGNSHHVPNSYYTAEPTVYNNSIPYDDPVYAAYNQLARRDSIWSDGSGGHLAISAGVVPLDKFSSGPELSSERFPYPAAPVYMPSTASSVTGLSTISRTPSIGSVYSPIQTEFTPDSCTVSSTQRGPSPLRHSTEASIDIPVTSLPGVEGTPGKNVLAAQRSGHLHVCGWGSNGVCDSGYFASRDELSRHVKMEHLLECPEKGCTETAFETRNQLAVHMQWDHSNSSEPESAVRQTTNLLPNDAQPDDDAPTPKAADSLSKSVDDRALKMEMSIGSSKRRCREQLRMVLEKRLRRANGLSRCADSPGTGGSRTPKLMESATFPVIWEHGVLPFLIEFIPKWCGPGHVISVTRGRKPNTRRVCIMTTRKITTARRIVIAGHVRDLLPDQHRSTITFVFSTGKVDRLVWARGLGKEMPDEVCEPRNPFAYISPCMGDSIGASLDDGEEATATLGPCITAEGGSYWLACFHPFIGASQRTSPVLIEHPSPQDRAECVQKEHDILNDVNYRVGNLTATSGFDLKTTRITHDPYWEDCDKENPLAVTDWILISSGTRQANMLRKFPNAAQRSGTPVTVTGPVTPGANVISTGRTSGYQRGQVCEVPAYVDPVDSGTGKATREWFIEEPFPYENENEWIRGGIGVEGDSGAAIMDSDTNALVGQLWGRNRYWGPGPRVTYFTPISDIFDDIQEKCGMLARPQLPQHRDEADRWPVYPVCKQCFDLREYLDSRRSSRASMLSMIGFSDNRGEHDNDLTSVSELATPKDQSYLFRHTGLEETASSFGGAGALSPAPVHAFCSLQAPSPGISELRSPYPQTLNDEDLYEPQYPKGREVAIGKRPAVLPPQGQNTMQQSEKRRRTTYDGQS